MGHSNDDKQMKKNALYILAAIAVLVGCNRAETSESLEFESITDSSISICRVNSSFPRCDTFAVERKYDICWPENASDELKRELIRLMFDDSTTDIHAASERFLDNLMLFDDDTLIRAIRVDKLTYDGWTSYENVRSECRQDSNLYCFTVSNENYMRYAAHGMYSTCYVTYDAALHKIVRLNDLVDTSKLSPVITRAIEDLVVNKEVLENVYTTDNLPVTGNFFIDSSRSCIVLVYPLYDIACYASGIQSVVLPVFWLSKHIELTPYAKELFGEGSYLKTNN